MTMILPQFHHCAVLLKNQNPWSPYGPPKAGGWVAHPNPGWPVITNVEIQTKLKLSDIENCIPWNPPPKKGTIYLYL